MAWDTGLWLWMFGVLTGPWVRLSTAHDGDSEWHVWRSLVIVAYWFSPAAPPHTSTTGSQDSGVSIRPWTLLEKFVFAISYCSLIEAPKNDKNKGRVTPPELVAAGGNWVILQITPAGTFANFIGVGDNKNNRAE